MLMCSRNIASGKASKMQIQQKKRKKENKHIKNNTNTTVINRFLVKMILIAYGPFNGFVISIQFNTI